MEYITHDLENTVEFKEKIIEFKKITSEGLLKYDDLLPYLKEFNEMFKKYNKWVKLTAQEVNNSIYKYDLYIDVIMYHIISSYLTFNSNDDLPTYCYVYVLICKPYLYNIIMCMKTNKEIKAFKESILKELKDLTLSLSTENTKKLMKLLETDEFENYENASALQQFKYFIDASFRINFQHKTFHEITSQFRNSKSMGFILVHCGYNNMRLNSLFINNSNYEKIETPEILTEEVVKKSNVIIHPSSFYKSTVPYSIVDDKLNDIKLPRKENLLLICYDDNKNLDKCHYTVCSFPCINKNKPEILSYKKALRKIEGEIYRTIDNKGLHSLINTDILSKKYDEPLDNTLDRMVTILRIVISTFNETSTYKDFADKFCKELTISKVINESELCYVIPYIKCYTGDYDIESVQKYVKQIFEVIKA